VIYSFKCGFNYTHVHNKGPQQYTNNYNNTQVAYYSRHTPKKQHPCLLGKTSGGDLVGVLTPSLSGSGGPNMQTPKFLVPC